MASWLFLADDCEAGTSVPFCRVAAHGQATDNSPPPSQRAPLGAGEIGAKIRESPRKGRAMERASGSWLRNQTAKGGGGETRGKSTQSEEDRRRGMIAPPAPRYVRTCRGGGGALRAGWLVSGTTPVPSALSAPCEL